MTARTMAHSLGTSDYFTPWLVPHSLLLFVQMAEPSDNMELRLRINGEALELKKAYSEIRKVTSYIFRILRRYLLICCW